MNINRLNEQKLKLEIQKITNELEFQSKPLKNPSNWIPITTIVSILATVISGWITGWFGLERDLLEKQKTVFEIDLREFKKERVTLESAIKNLKNEKALLLSKINGYQMSIAYAENRIDSLNMANQILTKEILTTADKRNVISIINSELSQVNDKLLESKLFQLDNRYLTISGKIADQNGHPLKGVLVQRGLNDSSVFTDSYGNFSLNMGLREKYPKNLNGLQMILVLSKAGFKSKKPTVFLTNLYIEEKLEVQ